MIKRLLLLALALLLSHSAVSAAPKKGHVHLAYGEWASNVASTHVIKAVLEQVGYEVTITPLMGAAMWEATAKSEVDGFLGAWLPTTHEDYYASMESYVEDLGVNLPDAKLGLVVPNYTNINSITELNDHAQTLGGVIVGVDYGAGVQRLTREAIEKYNFNLGLIDDGETNMIKALRSAIENKEDIVVTAWSPHWIFNEWDLKYLDDPKGIYGNSEAIHTIVRQGLKDDMPEVYAILRNFHWTDNDMTEVMLMIEQSEAIPADSVKKWVSEHPELVEKWTAANRPIAH